MKLKRYLTTKIMKKNNELNKIIVECRNSRSFRHALAYQSHEWFFRLYLNHHIGYPFSWFHKQMFGLSEEPLLKLIVLTAFRGAGKSTILNLSMILWSILGKPQKKFVIIISKTIFQAKAHLKNIIEELKENDLLKNDFNLLDKRMFNDSITSIEFKEYEAKIILATTKQALRGLKYKSHRPDLIICDDLESDNSDISDRSIKERDNWFKNEVMACVGSNSKIIILGTPIQETSIIIRLMNEIKEKRLKGIFKAYPFRDLEGKILWPEKFSDEELEKDLDGDWLTEYMLHTNEFSMLNILEGLESDLKEETISNCELKNIGLLSNNDYKIPVPTNIFKSPYVKLDFKNDKQG